jgi:hypothetical protein
MFEVRAAIGYDAEVYPVGDEEGVRESGGHEGRFQPPVGLMTERPKPNRSQERRQVRGDLA